MNTTLLDRQYAKLLMPRLELPKVVSNSPFRMLMRCPICGDSKTHRHKTRGSIYEGSIGKTRNVMLFNCFNCDNMGHGAIPFSLFLKQNYKQLYDQYRIEKFKQSGNTSQRRSSILDKLVQPTTYVEEKVDTKSVDFLDRCEYYQRISELPDTHPVKRYVKHRCIPEKHYGILGFTMYWKRLCNRITPDTFDEKSLEYDQPRLVIPIFTKDGLVAIQGRALRKDDGIRYQTIKVDESFDKIYGTERVDVETDVVFVEGPIDSLFLDNGVAITGGSISVSRAPYSGHRIWALDNEPHHRDTTSRMETLLESGERVVIWDRLPSELKQYKDINDMVMKGGATIEFINNYIKNNNVSGLSGKLRFNQWKRV